MRTTLITSLATVAALAACNDAGSFGSSSDKAKAAVPRPTATPAAQDVATPEPSDTPEGEEEPQGTFEVPANCTADGVTHAKLLTQSVKNGSSKAYVEYQVFTTDCEGKVRTVASDSVLFDVNSTTTGSIRDLRFEVQTPKRVLVTSGTMQVVQGSDLFGRTSPAYFHYMTDKRIEFSLPSKSFVFRIYLGGGRQVTIGTQGLPAGEAAVQRIETYLRFGQAKAVTTVVSFVD